MLFQQIMKEDSFKQRDIDRINDGWERLEVRRNSNGKRVQIKFKGGLLYQI